jgi:hypothetical protein
LVPSHAVSFPLDFVLLFGAENFAVLPFSAAEIAAEQVGTVERVNSVRCVDAEPRHLPLPLAEVLVQSGNQRTTAQHSYGPPHYLGLIECRFLRCCDGTRHAVR